MQVVADPNVLVSAVVTPGGVCAELLTRLLRSGLVVIVSPLLLGEVERVLARPKFRRIDPARRDAYLAFLSRESVRADDPPSQPRVLVEADPGDDYLVRLVLADSDRLLVTGDPHLLALSGTYPIVSPRVLLDRLGE